MILLVAILRERGISFHNSFFGLGLLKFTIVCTEQSFVLVKVKKFNDVACLLENYEVHTSDETIICTERNACLCVFGVVQCWPILALLAAPVSIFRLAGRTRRSRTLA